MMSDKQSELQDLRQEVVQLREAVQKVISSKQGKDIWDKLSTFSTLFSSAILGLVGLIATNVYNNRQLARQALEDQRANELKMQESTTRGRIEQVQVLEKFMRYIASQDPREREFGYAMFASLGQAELALRLITFTKDTAGTQVAQTLSESPDQNLKKAAATALLTIQQKLSIKSVLYRWEGSSYDSVETIGGRLTYGIGFWSGAQLLTLLTTYIVQPDARAADALSPFMERLRQHDMTLNTDQGFANALRTIAADPVMQNLQEVTFDTQWLDPILEMAAKLGLKEPLTIAILFDTAVQSGLSRVQKFVDLVSSTHGTPNRGTNEHEWIRAFDEQRHAYIKKIGERNPAFVSGLLKRADYFTRQIADGNWKLDRDPGP
jgi:predicted negative regulator of RcsB-dependent stress response